VSVHYEKVALIGLGLIASSMAHAMKRGGVAGQITGFARSVETRETARQIGFCDVKDSAAEAVEGADLVVLCVPIGAMAAVMQDIAPHLKAGATLTDVGSVKGAVFDAVLPQLPDDVHFVGGHPMAGTEHSGPASGFAALFDNRWCLIVPPEDADADAVARLVAFWEALGANIAQMAPDHHDRVCAVVSHAPHLIAYTMVGVADDLSRVTDSEVINYSAAEDATLEILGRFTEELFDLQRAIRHGDGDQLFDYFTRTRALRRGIVEAGQDTQEPNFGRDPAPKS